MSYKITYTDKYTGAQKTRVYQGSDAGAKGWAEALSADNGGRKASAVHVADGPYDHSGQETHIITVGK